VRGLDFQGKGVVIGGKVWVRLCLSGLSLMGLKVNTEG
jgi:hypothetical protein